ncbi:MAG TPA: hypothetical protein VLM85_33525 [Polyangiaceae bacterium]|nr:hypothetical protein [Polyangiaceae bacterium]
MAAETTPKTSEPAPAKPAERAPVSRARLWERARPWLFLAIPAVGLTELGLHLWQTHDVVPESDWRAASAAVAKLARPDDLIVFAPDWTDPLGRMYFGDALMTARRVGRAEDERFERAIEVSAHGGRDGALGAWPVKEEQRVGALTIRVHDNPHPLHILTDLVDRLAPATAAVFELEGGTERPCPFAVGAGSAGQVGFGMATPGARFSCGQSFAGESMLPEYPDYVPRRVIYASAPGNRGAVRIRFAHVKLGASLRGHHGIAVHQERDLTGPSVSLTWSIGDRVLGTVVHHDGDGWKQFELDTSDLAGQELDVVADVTCPIAGRPYGFEAITL